MLSYQVLNGPVAWNYLFLILFLSSHYYYDYYYLVLQFFLSPTRHCSLNSLLHANSGAFVPNMCSADLTVSEFISQNYELLHKVKYEKPSEIF